MKTIDWKSWCAVVGLILLAGVMYRTLPPKPSMSVVHVAKDHYQIRLKCPVGWTADYNHDKHSSKVTGENRVELWKIAETAHCRKEFFEERELREQHPLEYVQFILNVHDPKGEDINK